MGIKGPREICTSRERYRSREKQVKLLGRNGVNRAYVRAVVEEANWRCARAFVFVFCFLSVNQTRNLGESASRPFLRLLRLPSLKLGRARSRLPIINGFAARRLGQERKKKKKRVTTPPVLCGGTFLITGGPRGECVRPCSALDQGTKNWYSKLGTRSG